MFHPVCDYLCLLSNITLGCDKIAVYFRLFNIHLYDIITVLIINCTNTF